MHVCHMRRGMCRCGAGTYPRTPNTPHLPIPTHTYRGQALKFVVRHSNSQKSSVSGVMLCSKYGRALRATMAGAGTRKTAGITVPRPSKSCLSTMPGDERR